MKLKKVQVRMFRNILDSTEVDIQPDVTCLVGKNESGKTAFLQALWRLKPARMNPQFSVPDHYPAWLEKRHRLEKKNLDDVTVVEVWLEWQPADVKVVEDRFGAGVVAAGATLKLGKKYANTFWWQSAFGKALKEKDLTGTEPIVARIARHEGVERFDHGRPADVLLREREAVLKTLSDDTLKRFEKLFERVNKTL